MTSYLYFTATSWFPENVRVKPYSKHSGVGGLCHKNFAQCSSPTYLRLPSPAWTSPKIIHKLGRLQQPTPFLLSWAIEVLGFSALHSLSKHLNSRLQLKFCVSSNKTPLSQSGARATNFPLHCKKFCIDFEFCISVYQPDFIRYLTWKGL